MIDSNITPEQWGLSGDEEECKRCCTKLNAVFLELAAKDVSREAFIDRMFYEMSLEHEVGAYGPKARGLVKALADAMYGLLPVYIDTKLV